MRPEDKPIWYDVYKAFPPRLEPTFARPAPNIKIRPIFYEEDRIRAKFHKTVKQTRAIDLLNQTKPTECQMFIEIYNKLAAQGALSEEKIFDTALELLEDKLQSEKDEQTAVEKEEQNVPSLTQQFSTATETKQTVDIKDIFKE